jgi:two-component system response regulator GlrR
MASTLRSVLLVDDSPDTLEMYSLGLCYAGYRPVTASDADSALGQLKLEHPDVVVADLQLQRGRGGWELIEAIKNDPSTSAIPVIVLTGRTEPSIAVDARRVGCAAVLTKPCLPEELVLALRRVLPAVT